MPYLLSILHYRDVTVERGTREVPRAMGNKCPSGATYLPMVMYLFVYQAQKDAPGSGALSPRPSLVLVCLVPHVSIPLQTSMLPRGTMNTSLVIVLPYKHSLSPKARINKSCIVCLVHMILFECSVCV